MTSVYLASCKIKGIVRSEEITQNYYLMQFSTVFRFYLFVLLLAFGPYSQLSIASLTAAVKISGETADPPP